MPPIRCDPMKNWPKRFSFWLMLFGGAAFAAELAWLEGERREGLGLTLTWRQQRRRYEELAKTVPARTPQNEQAMAEELSRWRQQATALRVALFPQVEGQGGDTRSRSGEQIDAYFDVAALVDRLRAAAAAADVSVKPEEYFGFAAYAHESPPATDLARVRQQCEVEEMLLNCLFSSRPRELLAVKRESTGANPAAAARQQPDSFVLERGRSLRGDAGFEAMAFRVEFSGDTAALRGFLTALARATELFLVRSVDTVPVGGGLAEKAARKDLSSGLVARPALSRFTVTVEVLRPEQAVVARAP